jgi:dolichol-phosphate mannosyltransferase
MARIGKIETLDIVVPIFNEEDCLPELFARLETIRGAHPQYKVTYIFVNDGSRDRSSGMLTELALSHPHVKVIHFSRNFGHQAAITAGMDIARADAVAIIDADLQDPPELIPEMVARMAEGYEIVYGKRRSRPGESSFKLLTAKMFYRFLSKVLKVDIPEDTGDFRVISSKVVRTLRGMRENHRFIRGLIPWTGFRSTEFLYDRSARYAGTTKFSVSKMMRFALDAIFSFSRYPLRIAIVLGLIITVVGFSLGILVVFLRLCTTYTVPGISAVLVAVFIFGGVQSFLLGICGEYIGRIYEQIKHRPLYVVDAYLNHELSND